MITYAQVTCEVPTWLAVSPLFSGGTLVLFVAGEADWVTAPGLRSELIAALDESPEDVIVDVAGLTFCNSRGLDALHEAIEVLQQADARVRVRGMSRQLRWLEDRYLENRRGTVGALVRVG